MIQYNTFILFLSNSGERRNFSQLLCGIEAGFGGYLTSSSLKAIIETALKTASVDPVIVVILSGQDPSEMVIRAVL